MNNMLILAQAMDEQMSETITSEPLSEQGQNTTIAPSEPNMPATTSRPKGPLGSYSNLIFLGLMFVVFYFLLFRGPRKKQQRHKQMVKTLQKNDRVRTIGGIIGTVVDIKDDEITIKVDESNNTKIKVAPSAIGRNVSQKN